MELVLISACLVGDKVRYDGKGKYNPLVKEILQKYDLVPVCPEVLGGMNTPRLPSEILNGKVINNKGIDVTKYFVKGSHIGLKIGKYNYCKKAILQEESPSCGTHLIHDGTFKNKVIEGKGIFTKLLIENGIECYTIDEFYNKFIVNEKK